jgi:hypothetical protein
MSKEEYRPQLSTPTEQLKPQLEGGNGVRGIPSVLQERSKPPPQGSAHGWRQNPDPRYVRFQQLNFDTMRRQAERRALTGGASYGEDGVLYFTKRQKGYAKVEMAAALKRREKPGYQEPGISEEQWREMGKMVGVSARLIEELRERERLREIREQLKSDPAYQEAQREKVRAQRRKRYRVNKERGLYPPMKRQSKQVYPSPLEQD